MAREKTIMELQDILKRLKAGHTIKQIKRETGTHREVIRKLKNIALQKDWFKKDKPLPTEKQLHDTCYGETKTTSHVLDVFHDELVEYHKSGLEAKMTFESFDFRFNARIHEPVIRELGTCSFVERTENVFLRVVFDHHTGKRFFV